MEHLHVLHHLLADGPQVSLAPIDGQAALQPGARVVEQIVHHALDAVHGNLDAGSGLPGPFTPAEFTLQFVEGVQQFRFDVGGGS